MPATYMDEPRSEWTLEALAYHLETSFARLQQDMDRRFDELERYRAALGVELRALLSQREYQAQHDALISKIDTIDTQTDQRLNALVERVSVVEGTKAGSVQAWAWTAAAFGAAVAITSIIIAIVTHH